MNRFIQIYKDNNELGNHYQHMNHPVLSLEQALVPLSTHIYRLDQLLALAKSSYHSISSYKLTRDESVAIYLYTIERGDQSLHFSLSLALYSGRYLLIKPWHGFLSLFNAALTKLPSLKATIWRGVDFRVAGTLRDNEEITWSNFSSCSLSLSIIRDLLNADSILCSIEAINGKRIRDFAYNINQDEVLLLPGTRLRVKSKKIDRSTNKLILYLEEIPDGSPMISASSSTFASTTKLLSSDGSSRCFKQL